MSEDKYANSLDRLLYPFIDEHLEWDSDDGDVYEARFGSDAGVLHVRQDFSGKELVTTVTVDDVLVYERRSGWTHTMRPGAWITALYEIGARCREKKERHVCVRRPDGEPAGLGRPSSFLLGRLGLPGH